MPGMILKGPMVARKGLTFFPAQASGPPPDPLAGISFVFRFETHNGDKVPQGMYTDVDGTVAAGLYDTVAAVRNWRGDNSIVATQSNSSRQPTLMQAGDGTPVLLFDGVDDYLAFPVSSPSAPVTMFAAADIEDHGSPYERLIGGGIGDSQLVFGKQGDDSTLGIYASFVGGTFSQAIPTGYHAWTLEFNVVSSLVFQDGTQVLSTSTVFGSYTNLWIGGNGAAGSGVEFAECNLVSFILYAGVPSTGDQQTVETYLATINPH